MEEENAFLKKYEFSYLENLLMNTKFLYSSAAICFIVLVFMCFGIYEAVEHNKNIIDFENIKIDFGYSENYSKEKVYYNFSNETIFEVIEIND